MFWIFVVKELKSIVRDPKLLVAMVVVPLIFVGVLYAVLGHGIRQQAEEAVRASGIVAVLDFDKAEYSERFATYLKHIGLNVELIDADSEESPLAIAKGTNAKILYIIPSGFSANISNLKPAKLYIYVKIESLTLGEGGIIGVASRYVELFSENLINTIAKERGIPEDFLNDAVTSHARGVLGDKLIEDPYGLFLTLTFGGMFIPLAIVMLISFSSQLVATGIAIEKEEKMFETLLSLPLRRMSVIGAKLLVSILISLVFFIAYGLMLFGFLFGQISITMGEAQSSEVMGMGIRLPSNLVLPVILNSVGLVLFMASIALILGLLVEDVRSAQAIVGNLTLPAVVLIYTPLFIDISSPLARIALSLTPIANTVFLPKLVIVEDVASIVLASTSNIAYGFALLLFIKRIVNSETVFTLRLRRRRPKT